MMHRMSANPSIQYACRQCGACCRWPGIVRLRPDEIQPLADCLGMAPADFIARYTALAPDRQGLILTEQADGACIFLEGNRCRVHAVKPQQCRDFPARWNFAGFEKLCQARRIGAPFTGQSPARHVS